MKTKNEKTQDLPLFPLLEIFGGALGVLLLLVIILLIQQERVRQAQKNPENLGGPAQVKLDSLITGVVVSCHKDYLRIEGEKIDIPLQELNKERNRFIDYCRDVYMLENDKRICAFVYPESNDVVMRLEKILIHHVPKADGYNFLVINEEIMQDLEEIGEKYFGK